MRSSKTLIERFVSRIYIAEDVDDGCHIWTGYTDEDGYGVISANGKNQRAHRVSYVFSNGEIPEGLQIRHTCDNRPCVNPAHLLVGTTQDNTGDMMSRGRHHQSCKTHCSQGHPYDEANTYIRPHDGNRDCIICRKSYKKARRGIWNKDKTHCPQGHEYNHINTYISSDGRRQCNTCRAARDKARNIIAKALRCNTTGDEQ